MLLLVATNPSIDRNIDIPAIKQGEVYRSRSLKLTAGGKAINSARAASILGVPTLITGFLGGYSGHLLAKLVADEGLNASWSQIACGETKMSHLLHHEGGDSTVINEPGPLLSREDAAQFRSLVLGNARDAQAVILAGSIPPGFEPADYASLCRTLAKNCPLVYVDTPGDSLKAVLEDPRGLSIKVNKHELGDALGISLNNPGAIHAAMRSVIGAGAALIGVTLGAEGAAIATSQGAWFTDGCKASQTVSSVGSGDSFTAGLAVAQMRGLPLDEALRYASACGAANAESLYPAVFTRARAEELLAHITAVPF